MKNFFLIAASALALSACSTVSDTIKTAPDKSKAAQQSYSAQEIASETAKLNMWFDEKYEEQVLMSPMQLTFLGRKERYDEVDDMSEAAEDKQLAWRAASVAEMKSTFNYHKLSAEAQISYDIWEYQYTQAKAGVPFRHNGYVFEQMGGPQAFIPTFMISFHRVENESDMEAYIKRLDGAGRAMEQLLVRAKASAERGVHAPLFAYEGVLEQAEKVITGEPFTDGEPSSLMADATGKIDALVQDKKITAARGNELKMAAQKAMLGQFKSSYENLIAWVKQEIPTADKIASGVGSQPNGEAYYNYALASATTTDMTADEVHALGLSEVARLSGEMIKIKQAVGFKGDLASFFVHIREGKQFYYPDTDDGRKAYIDDATVVIDEMKKMIPDYFGILPKADLIVKRVEPFREQDGAAQHYYPGTPDGSRAGIYYAHLSDMTAMPKNQLEVIAYHEGLPGHHMQISIAQELESVPQFRTQAGFTAYAEGWALYSELLAKEMGGTYADPYSDFGRLTTEMWRGIRLVVDTGLHSKGWTEQQAIEYFMENSPEPLASVTSEVQRYIVWPGQATSYKIGMLKILELRAKAKAALGEDFDIKGFHDTVLGGGALPLAVLERRVDQWIASQK